ncbi:MAG: thioredoxin domain-containing protein [Patescibacteria group bacterium]
MEQTTHNQTQKPFDMKQLIMPLSILIAGALIAFGVYASEKKGSDTTASNGKDLINGALQAPEIEVAKVTDEDHLRGDKDAKIAIIEYSDTECPFCKVYHETMKKIFAEYGSNKQVVWVYRHFPLSYGDQVLHKYAAKEAEATECATELGGKDAFWKYIDEIYATTKSNDGLDPATLPDLAAKVGLDKAKMKACIDSGKYAEKVKASYDAGAKAGAAGTPYTVIQFKGENIPLVNEQGQGLGALPYDVMKKIIDQMLATK